MRNAALDNPLLKRFGFETAAVEASMEGAEQAFRLGVLQGLLDNGAQLPAGDKEKICENVRRRFRDIEFARFNHVGESPSTTQTVTTSNALYSDIRSSIKQHIGQLSASLSPRIRSAALASVCRYEDYWLLKAKYLGALQMDDYIARFLNGFRHDAAIDEELMRAAFRASLDRHYDGYVRAVAALEIGPGNLSPRRCAAANHCARRAMGITSQSGQIWTAFRLPRAKTIDPTL